MLVICIDHFFIGKIVYRLTLLRLIAFLDNPNNSNKYWHRQQIFAYKRNVKKFHSQTKRVGGDDNSVLQQMCRFVQQEESDAIKLLTTCIENLLFVFMFRFDVFSHMLWYHVVPQPLWCLCVGLWTLSCVYDEAMTKPRYLTHSVPFAHGTRYTEHWPQTRRGQPTFMNRNALATSSFFFLSSSFLAFSFLPLFVLSSLGESASSAVMWRLGWGIA